MRAAVHERYGPPEVVEVREVPTPEPAAGEIRIRVRATTVTSGDWRIRSMTVPPGFRVLSRLLFGVFRPRQRILGTECSGEIDAVGEGVDTFAVGDPVFAYRGAAMGCHAELVTMPADAAVARKPANLDFDEAAALSFGGTTALHFLRKGGVGEGDRVLVIGASGGVGTAAVQIARHLGAAVTGVCSTDNVDLVRSLGAADVIDYTREDFASGGRTWDVVLDTVGTGRYGKSRRALTPTGRLLLVYSGMADMLRAPWVGLVSKRRIVAGPAPERIEDLRELAAMAEAGAYRPVIDRRWPLDEIVEAHRRVDGRHKRGNVVVTMCDGGDGS